MPLVDNRPPPSPLNVQPLRTTAAAVGAALVFVVGVAVVARWTADAQDRSPRAVLGAQARLEPAAIDVRDDDVRDVGTRDDDAGTAIQVGDGRAVQVTVPMADDGVADGGPADVPGPPFSPAAVVDAAVVVVQACAIDALRWDPSLGGVFGLQVDLGPLFVAPDGAAAPRIATPGLLSPVLSNCLARRSGDVQLPPLGDVSEPLAVHARAVLDAGGRITWSDAVVTTSRSGDMKSTDAPE